MNCLKCSKGVCKRKSHGNERIRPGIRASSSVRDIESDEVHRCKSETVAVRDTDESQYEYYYQPVNHPDEATPVLRNHPNPHIEEIKQKQLDRITKRQGKRPTAKLHSKSLCNELLDESDYEVLSALRNTPAAQSPVWNELVQLPVERKERHQDNAANLESPGQDKPTSDLPTPVDENQSANNVSQAPTVSTLGRIRQKLSTFFHRKSVGPAILAPPPEAKSEPEDFYLEMWSQRELPELPDSEDSDDEDYDSIYNWDFRGELKLSAEKREIGSDTIQRLREEAEGLVHTKGDLMIRQRGKKGLSPDCAIEKDSLHIRVIINPFIRGKAGYITKRSRKMIMDNTKRVIEAIGVHEDGWLLCSLGRQQVDNEEFFFAYAPFSTTKEILCYNPPEMGVKSADTTTIKASTSGDSFFTAEEESADGSEGSEFTYHKTEYTAFTSRSDKEEYENNTEYDKVGTFKSGESYQQLAEVNPIARISTRGTMTEIPQIDP